MTKETMQGVRFESQIGTWHEIDRLNAYNLSFIMFESDQYGNDAYYIIASDTLDNGSFTFILLDVSDWDDLHEHMSEDLEWDIDDSEDF